MSTFDINEIQIKQIKQELLLKSTEVIELNNAINNLKSQKALFINSVYNELQVSMKKVIRARQCSNHRLLRL